MMRGPARWIAAPVTVRLARWTIGALFAAAALAKIGDPAAFAAQVHNFRMVPIPLENLVAMTLPWIELIAALALLLGIRPRAGAFVAGSLMLIFTVAVAVALARGLSIECGCFGKVDSSRVGWVKLGQNVGMLAIAAVAMLRPVGLRPIFPAAAAISWRTTSGSG